MIYSLLENNLAPLIIKKENRNVYTEILHDAQTKEFPSDDDIQRFYDFASPLMIEEEKRILSFYNQEKQQISDDELGD